MQSYERVRVEPVATDVVATVDHDHLTVRMVDEGVGEGEAGRPSADDQVVGPQRASHPGSTTARVRWVNVVDRTIKVRSATLQTSWLGTSWRGAR